MLGRWKKIHYFRVVAEGGGGKVVPVLFSLVRTDSEETHSFRISPQIQI